MDLRFIFLLLFCVNNSVGLKRYNNFTLFRGMPINEQHLQFFKNMSEVYDINFWKPPSLVNISVDFTMNPKDSDAFVVEAAKRKIYLTTIMKDVQSAFDNQTVKKYIRRNMDSFNWLNYYKLEDINTWLEDLRKSRPKEIELLNIGSSIEGRPIVGLKIVLKGSKRRSKVIIEGGIHAREWISTAVVTYIINQIVNARDAKDKEFRKIALTYEWYIIPVLNPDGYEYTHSHDRQWRKNRRGGYGVDINRNFGVAFGTVGVNKNNKRSEEHCGDRAFSEPESKAMARFVKKHQENLEYYMAFHSYGLLFIIPYAYTKQHHENFDEMHKIGKKVAAKISKRYGTKYKVGTAYDTVGYMASGVSSCWAKKVGRIPYVATVELRDEGDYGFALPPEQILPTCQETMDGLIELFKPKTREFSKLSNNVYNIADESDEPDGQVMNIPGRVLIVFNMVLLILMSFAYNC